MVRDRPLDPPTLDEVTVAARAVLDGPIAGVTPFEEGLNAVYRVDRESGPPAVLKAATFVTDAELLTEAAVHARLRAETAVPLPAVLAVEGSGPLKVACYVAEYCPGRTEPDVLALSPTARRRLAAESGRHLAAIHGVRVADGFGELELAGRPTPAGTGRPAGADVELAGPGRPWAAWFEELVDRALSGLTGEGQLTDDDPRFADLVDPVRTALSGVDPGNASPSFLMGDYRPANLVLAPGDDADPLVRAVLDVGVGPTADGALDLALVEDALVDVPLGGTPEADRLRAALRTAYADHRGVDPEFGGDRYAAYRLYARVKHLGAFGYWRGFAREDDPDRVAGRWRAFVRDRIDESV